MRHSKYLLLLVAFALLAVAPSISSASGQKRSGVHGSVRRGPIAPTCQPENPCTAPAVGVRLTFVRGSVAHRTRTKAGGRYSMRLAPGRYSVHVSGAPFGFSPQQVTVRKKHLSTMNIVIDTGIR